MAAYMICTMKVHDPVTFKKYSDHTPKTLTKYGGRFLTRGDEVTTSEGAVLHRADGDPRVSRPGFGRGLVQRSRVSTPVGVPARSAPRTVA